MSINIFTLIKLNIINIQSFMISIDIIIDWISLLFIRTVIIISRLIIIFRKYYIPKNEQKQFLLLLLIFVLSIEILILRNNLFIILLGWDGLGLSSYILVIYYQNFSTAASGTITLLSNRIGDILILLSIRLIIISSNWRFNINIDYSILTLIFLTLASISKRAQFPFSAWLPIAIAAPTPISALVHSSTLVTAGVFLILRIFIPNHPTISIILLIISTSTAIYARISANWEKDLKKIIALSTLRQIAIIIFAISINSIILAFTHLIIHALFKSAIFLCAGIIIHESSYQDIRIIGLNYTIFPLTLSILGINRIALIGIPFISGFFSKDIILEKIISSNINLTLLVIITISVGITSIYSIRISLLSNKSIIKLNPLLHNHYSINSTLPIILLRLFGITSGSWLSWILSPEQLYLTTNIYKIIILLRLLIGLILRILIKFKNKKYIKLGESSISLWFSHYISVIPNNYLSQIIKIYQNNDNSWKEIYGPQKSFTLIKYNSKIATNFNISSIIIIIILLLIPTYLL